MTVTVKLDCGHTVNWPGVTEPIIGRHAVCVHCPVRSLRVITEVHITRERET